MVFLIPLMQLCVLFRIFSSQLYIYQFRVREVALYFVSQLGLQILNSRWISNWRSISIKSSNMTRKTRIAERIDAVRTKLETESSIGEQVSARKVQRNGVVRTSRLTRESLESGRATLRFRSYLGRSSIEGHLDWPSWKTMRQAEDEGCFAEESSLLQIILAWCNYIGETTTMLLTDKGATFAIIDVWYRTVQGRLWKPRQFSTSTGNYSLNLSSDIVWIYSHIEFNNSRI